MNNKYNTQTSFIDLLFNVTLIILLCFLLTEPYINPAKTVNEGVQVKSEFLITLEWEGASDVDLYVQDPLYGTCFFSKKVVDGMHLDYDSQGSKNDYIDLPDGRRQYMPVHNEIVSLRQIVPGEYVINAHLYQARDADNVALGKAEEFHLKAKITVQKLLPNAKVVYVTYVEFSHDFEEVTAVRLTLDAQGTITNIGTEPKRLQQT